MTNEPYENVLLGSFIYSLGYMTCENKIDPKDSLVHLIQQTPADKPWGDLLNSWSGQFFIFEFKRAENWLKKEHLKKYCNKECSDHCEKHKNKFFTKMKPQNPMYDISEKCHFAAFGKPSDDGLSINFMKYKDIRFKPKQSHVNHQSMLDFVEEMLSGGSGADSGEFIKYLGFLSECVGSSSANSSGIVVNRSSSGALHVVEAKAIKDLVADLNLIPPRDPAPEPVLGG